MADRLEVQETRALSVESNGLNVIAEAERKGRPAQLFWPWFAANVSVLGHQLRRVHARRSGSRSGRR